MEADPAFQGCVQGDLVLLMVLAVVFVLEVEGEKL